MIEHRLVLEVDSPDTVKAEGVPVVRYDPDAIVTTELSDEGLRQTLQIPVEASLLDLGPAGTEVWSPRFDLGPVVGPDPVGAPGVDDRLRIGAGRLWFADFAFGVWRAADDPSVTIP